MKTLVLHAPKAKNSEGHARDFREISQSGIGPSYAVYSRLILEIEDGCEVIVISKDTKREARGKLLSRKAVGMTRNHIVRYNFYIKVKEN